MEQIKKLFITSVALVALGGISYYLYGMYKMYAPQTREDSSFDTLREENADFAHAVDILQNGGDRTEAQSIFEDQFAKAEQRGEYSIAGVMKLWLAISQDTRSGDPAVQSEYLQALVDVASDDRYHPRTRKYALAFVGAIFSRLLALNDPQYDAVLDIPFQNPVFKSALKKNVDGSVNHRESITALLVGGVPGTPNPLVSARVASIIIRGVEVGEFPEDERAFRVAETIRHIKTARQYEIDLQSGDTTFLYSSYLFLEAQVYGKIATVEGGKYAAEILDENIDALYEKAIAATIAAGGGATELSVRYGYAKYLVSKYEQTSKHTSAEAAQLTKALDALFEPVASSDSLKDTSMFDIILVASKNRNSPDYEMVQAIASHSPVFKTLIFAQ